MKFDELARLVTISASVSLASACATSPLTTHPDADTELRSLEAQWANARVNGDVSFLEKFYGSELQLNQMNGGVVERKDDIALFAARAIKPEYIHNTELRVLVYGESAVMTGIESLAGTYGGNRGNMSLRFTNVFTYQDGRWQLVAHQSTPIEGTVKFESGG